VNAEFNAQAEDSCEIIARHFRVLTFVSGPHVRPGQFFVLYREKKGLVEPFVPLLQFFIDRGVESCFSWQKSCAGSVRLLLDHLESAEQSVASTASTALQQFVDDLVAGTVDADGNDGRGLCWPGCSRNTAAIHLSRVSEFADWLSERYGSRPLNPWRNARAHERIVQLKRREHRAANALLSHAAYRRNEQSDAAQVRSVRVNRGLHSTSDLVAFADEGFARLVTHGWSRNAPSVAPLHVRYRLRNLMISVLMHGAGLRLSECFHLYQGDVVEDPDHPGSALVFQFHPVSGAAPLEPGGPWRNREDYLHRRWGLRPRNLDAGVTHAGWKDLALLDGRRRCTQAFWFPAACGTLFWKLYCAYVRHRPVGNHPFLFTSERKSERGQPYTIKAFEAAHDAAVRRAGLVPGKRNGTSPHGHRHAMGLRLVRAGFDRPTIQKILHHKSPFSQDAYSRAPSSEISKALREASHKIDALLPGELLSLSK
jgi:Phage integrase family